MTPPGTRTPSRWSSDLLLPSCGRVAPAHHERVTAPARQLIAASVLLARPRDGVTLRALPVGVHVLRAEDLTGPGQDAVHVQLCHRPCSFRRGAVHAQTLVQGWRGVKPLSRPSTWGY